ncbi:NepR family anti-sigma factor [Sandaracinobacteroides sp. A072]|uniref:NepR family anti-sigma factor n=1 Tax=Sandaracinobacteroides sp. A072 TaxID=3461146 RepID=UPI0040426F49
MKADQDRKRGTGSQAGGQQAGRRRGRSDDPISLGLRQLWADVENEPVPDDFLAILDAIDARAGGAESQEQGGNDLASAGPDAVERAK